MITVRAVLIFMFCCSFLPAENRSANTRIIYDTDLGPDSDDAGALAMLHALQTKKEAQILAVICSTTSPWCAPCADAVNHYYKRPDIPVGTLKGDGWPGGSETWPGDAFNGYISGHFPNRIRHGDFAADALILYRTLLVEQADSSVVIAVTGPLTNLRNLLNSGPDSISSLAGLSLVRRKVRLLAIMGGHFPEGSESNFMCDAEAAKTVVEEWPTPIVFSGYEIGEEILTGSRLAAETPSLNPVRQIYHLWDRFFMLRHKILREPASY